MKKESTIKEIIEKAKEADSQNKKWHFHILGKNCKFNENKGKFEIVFESEKETLFSVFNEKPLKKAKKLADLMYGKNFLEEKGEGKKNKDFELILNKVKELEEKGIEWHHHHLHPDCIFNEKKKMHAIVLESEGIYLTAFFDSKPMKDLIKIEKLFYKELKQ